MSVRLFTAQSRSHSETGSLILDAGTGPTLNYTFLNRPKTDQNPELAMHQGTCVLVLSKLGTARRFDGEYYSSRGRANYGSIWMERVSSEGPQSSDEVIHSPNGDSVAMRAHRRHYAAHILDHWRFMRRHDEEHLARRQSIRDRLILVLKRQKACWDEGDIGEPSRSSAWGFVTALAIGYMLRCGLAKSGTPVSREHHAQVSRTIPGPSRPRAVAGLLSQHGDAGGQGGSSTL